MSLSQKENQPLLTYLVEVLLIDDAPSNRKRHSFLFEGARHQKSTADAIFNWQEICIN